MGVNISELVEPVKKEVEIESLVGRKIAIDAMNVLYQFLSIIRQPDGTPLKDSKGNITSHLSGLFYRTTKLLQAGIKPCYVFDGKPPQFKEKTNLERMERREEARRKYKEALERGDVEEARKWAQQGVKVDEDIVKDAKDLLDAMGIPYIQAPSEGEAQAAFLCKEGKVWAASSQDYDSLLFGTPILLRNITITGKRKLPGKESYIEIKPEMIRLEDLLKHLGIERKKLILIGILVGTDYDPGGISGIGPKRALELVRTKSVEKVIEEIKKDWKFDVKPEEILEFFENPPVEKNCELKWKEPDEEKVKKILCDEHDFSVERVENTLAKLRDSKGTQSRLDSWFK
ncbi:MAG: flap endonuclease-1 [Candidatus Aenigmarchaeota archaeon]|nr:flap endonuclease-1 [Candidatus Aenigmarchaeota archaeon]